MKWIATITTYLLAAVTASAHGISEADQAGILDGGNLEYLKLGARHWLRIIASMR